MEFKPKEICKELFREGDQLNNEIFDKCSNLSAKKISDEESQHLKDDIFNISDSFRKDFQLYISSGDARISNLIRTIIKIDNGHSHHAGHFSNQIQILFTLRSLLLDRLKTLDCEYHSEKELGSAIRLLTDTVITQICRQFESTHVSRLKSNERIIDNLKIVKNDLQKQLNLIYQLIKDTPTGLIGCDSDLTIKLWNSVAENMTGFEPPDIIGKSLLNIFTNPSKKVIEGYISQDLQRRKHMKLNIQTKEGGIFNADVFINRLKSELKQKIHYIVNIMDSSKEEIVKSQLKKIEQLGAIARLSDAVMHDVRNPINSIALNIDVLTQILKDDKSDKPEISMVIERIHRQISGLSHTLNRYVGYSRITELNLTRTDIRKPLDDMIVDKRNQLGDKMISLNYRRAKNELLINGDADQLTRVFNNLLENAIDAIGVSGNIDVTVQKKNKRIIVSIADDGAGIKAENMSNIFKPYFTTKNKGSGLGLFIVREIIHAHRGKVYCTSSDEGGTRFTISIPALMTS